MIWSHIRQPQAFPNQRSTTLSVEQQREISVVCQWRYMYYPVRLVTYERRVSPPMIMCDLLESCPHLAPLLDLSLGVLFPRDL